MNDLRSFGYFFETLAVRDLHAYAEAHFGGIDHYLDRNGLECDVIVHSRNGRYGLIEVKLGGDDLIEEGAATLNKLAKILNPEKMRMAFLFFYPQQRRPPVMIESGKKKSKMRRLKCRRAETSIKQERR